MSENSVNSKRIAKNTLMLYFRMLLLMGATLYTSRVVLAALGVEDYGIYNVVGGVVAMFTMISGSLSSAISRFITFELGKGDQKRLNAIFSTSVIIQILIGVIIAILVETVGVWFLANKMVIPDDRFFAAKWVLQFSLITLIINLVSIPYNAAIIAHERMGAFAYISILEAAGKLAIAYFITIAPIDKLIFYAILMAFVALVVRFTYSIYCRRHFEECKFQWVFDRQLLGEMFGFAGWNFFGSAALLLKNQGVNIVLNMFFNPAVNAARGIAMQVNTAINGFVSNFMTAVNPQIIKSYAAGDHGYMMSLIYRSSTLSFYLMMILSMPVLIETVQILSIWLVEVPEYAAVFVQLILFDVLINTLSQPLITAQLATGRIKMYQIIVGGTSMLNIPISYMLLRFGMQPESTVIVAIALSIVNLINRIFILHRLIDLSVLLFLKKVVAKVSLVFVLSAVAPLGIYNLMQPDYTRVIIVCLVSLLSSSISIYFVGIDIAERRFITDRFKIIISKYCTK